MHPYRTHNCGTLRLSDKDRSVRLSGWVHRMRDHGGLLFIDLRDHYGQTQCVIDPNADWFRKLGDVSPESVLRLDGRIAARSKDTINKDIATGQIELQAESGEILSRAAPLPFPVFAEPEYAEDLRLAWRFLDLRRKTLHERITLRAAIIASLRRRMQEAGFCEFQTPILTAASPEGARDFLVPSRLNRGKFYALPQAPQIFKQLIMAAGFDRYFQIAPCFRDEDARADRSPGEFYQLDVEMSFVTQDDVFAAVEPILHGLFEEFAAGEPVSPLPFPRIPYAEAMLLYGSDKPDLRNPIRIADVSAEFMMEGVDFRAFRDIIGKGGVVRAIPAPAAAARPRSFFDGLNDWARKEMRAPGLGYMVFGDDMKAKGPIAKFVPESIQALMAEKAGVKAGDALFFACDMEKQAAALAGAARSEIGRRLDIAAAKGFHFCWVVDFPMFERDDASGKVIFSHNPFSMPQGGMDALAGQDPLAVRAFQYDIVCNGVELSSGAIRAHDPDVLLKAFEIAGYDRGMVEKEFSALLKALRLGAPPHGGVAPGIDRIIMLLAHASSLREVIMFPMNQQAQDLLMDAPAPVDEKRLKELGLKILPPEADKE